MKQQLWFDLKKVSYDRMYLGLFLFILFIFLSPLINFRNMDMESSKIIELRDEINITQEGIEQMKEANVPLDVKDEEERLVLLQAFYTALSENQLDEVVKTQLAYEKKMLEQMEQGSRFGIPIIEQRKAVAELDFLYAKNLVPINKFDSSVPAVNFISNGFQTFIPFTMILIFPVLIFSRIYTTEKNHGTKDFINMTPISFIKSSTSKLTISILFSFFYFILSVCLAGLITFFKNGFGFFNYPIPISKDGKSVDLLTTGQFLIQLFILLFFIYIFLASLSFLISRFTNSFLIQTVILLVVVMLPSSPLFTADSAIAGVAHFLPFSYFDLSKVLTFGDSYSPMINEHITFVNGLICLVSYSILCLLLSLIVIKKKRKF